MNYQSEYAMRYITCVNEWDQLIKHYEDFIEEFCGNCNNPFSNKLPGLICPPIRFMFPKNKNSFTTNLKLCVNFETEYKIITREYRHGVPIEIIPREELLVGGIELRFIWHYKPSNNEMSAIRQFCKKIKPTRVIHECKINGGKR
jgi:hypothetical protein